MKRSLVVACLVLSLACSTEVFADAVGYIIPTGTAGNQNFGGELGMDFNVAAGGPVTLTHLGVFDASSNGLSSPITVRLWDRSNTATPLATIAFASGATGQLVGGSRYLPLATPITLPAGFLGTISASGYSAAELAGNKGVAAFTSFTNNDGGALSFVGSGRFGGTPGAFPGGLDGGPADRYAAGTFVTHNLSQSGISHVVPAGAIGNTSTTGSVGMDFNVTSEFGVNISQLGVFDSLDAAGNFGINGTLTAKLYDRNNPATALATLQFTNGSPGTLINGSRFKSLSGPLFLPFGFQGSIVAEGFSASDLYGDAGTAANPIWILDADPLGGFDFVGTGRTGALGAFPGTPTGAGAANRFAAGTFAFEVRTPEPASVMLWSLLGAVGLGYGLWRRRKS